MGVKCNGDYAWLELCTLFMLQSRLTWASETPTWAAAPVANPAHMGQVRATTVHRHLTVLPFRSQQRCPCVCKTWEHIELDSFGFKLWVIKLHKWSFQVSPPRLCLCTSCVFTFHSLHFHRIAFYHKKVALAPLPQPQFLRDPVLEILQCSRLLPAMSHPLLYHMSFFPPVTV